ncbi:MAG: DUF402 domain-containing protein [Clostridia bacterium]|nr:DUF402 domain-containing protein [Clostridia bacterium]
MKKPTVLRKRFIPNETVDISADTLLHRSEELLITKWNVIRPRTDFSSGVSYSFLKEGYKISRFYDASGKFLYWYCDIIEVIYDEEKDTYTMIDLLVDIKLMPDGTLKVLDTDELAEALEREIITIGQACRALKKLDELLKMIDSGNFPPLACRSEEYWSV